MHISPLDSVMCTCIVFGQPRYGDGFLFSCYKQWDCCLGSISTGDKPPTTQWLKQQLFYCSGIRAELSRAVLLCSVCCITDEAGSLVGLGHPQGHPIQGLISLIDFLPPWPPTPPPPRTCLFSRVVRFLDLAAGFPERTAKPLTF